MEFSINETVYRACKLDAFAQLHVLRRLTPCLGKLAALSGGVQLKYDEDGKVVDIEGGLDKVLTPLAEAITSLSDEDVEYVLNACLEAVERKQGAGLWVRVRKQGLTMFDGLSLPTMLRISWYVLQENLTDFFSDLPSLSGMEGILKERGLIG